MLTVSFPLRAKSVRIPLRMNTESGAQFIPIGLQTGCWQTFPVGKGESDT